MHQVQAVILEDCPSVPTVISPLKPRGNFMYRMLYTSIKYKYCITACLWVSCDSHNKKKIFLYVAIAGSFYNRDGQCLLRGTAWLFIKISVISTIHKLFHGSGG
jgi:hypothetical protein